MDFFCRGFLVIELTKISIYWRFCMTECTLQIFKFLDRNFFKLEVLMLSGPLLRVLFRYYIRLTIAWDSF